MSGPDHIGTCCVVLHSHLPWLAHHGSWPVGEEWLYQAWAGSYLPVCDVVHRLAEEGRTELLTFGVTPVLAAMLDDPHCLNGFHTWLGTWEARVSGACVRDIPTADYEGALARRALSLFEARWIHGGSPVLRELADRDALELLGGPATHSLTPHLPGTVRDFSLAVGLADATLRVGRRPEGIWAPECAYSPGLEEHYAMAGVRRFVVDGPTVRGRTGAPVDVAGSGVLAFARDLEVSYRVWSPRAGYPGGGAYRDFHTFDHDSGLRPARVTSKRTPPEHKRPYAPHRAAAAVVADAADFVGQVRRRLLALPEDSPLVVVAYDTELFGHWWHEGPTFLEAVLRQLPAAGVRVTTLRRAAEDLPARRAELPAGSWGAGKDFRVWQVPDMTAAQDEVNERWLRIAAKRADGAVRDQAHDQLAREALLALASDWPYCVTRSTAASYARERADGHTNAFRRIADALESGDSRRAQRVASAAAALDYPFGHLDSRPLSQALLHAR